MRAKYIKRRRTGDEGKGHQTEVPGRGRSEDEVEEEERVGAFKSAAQKSRKV